MALTDAIQYIRDVNSKIETDPMSSLLLGQRVQELCDALEGALVQIQTELQDAYRNLECDCPSCIGKRRA